MRELNELEITLIAGGDWSSCSHTSDNVNLETGVVTPVYTCQDYTFQGQTINGPYTFPNSHGNMGPY